MTPRTPRHSSQRRFVPQFTCVIFYLLIMFLFKILSLRFGNFKTRGEKRTGVNNRERGSSTLLSIARRKAVIFGARFQPIQTETTPPILEKQIWRTGFCLLFKMGNFVWCEIHTANVALILHFCGSGLCILSSRPNRLRLPKKSCN